MYIKTLKLINFRSHQNTALALDRITIIRGKNADGKSSIQDALEFLLTGCTRQTDAGGRGADLLISHGAKEMAVRAEIEFEHEGIEYDGGQLSRTRSQAGGSLLAEGPDFLDSNKVGKHAEAWIAENIAPIPVLQACLCSGRFLSLSEKEQKALLTAALASKAVKVPDDIVKIMNALVKEEALARSCDEVQDSATAEQIYDLYFKLRTCLNRDIKALGELTAPDIPADAPDAATVRKDIAGIRKEREGLVTSKTRSITQHAADILRKKTAQGQLDQFKNVILADDELEKLRKVAGKLAKANEIKTEINGFVLAIDNNKESLKALKVAPQECPTCKQPLAVANSDKQINELEDAIAASQRFLSDARIRLEKLGDPITADQKLNDHKKAVIATGSAERALRELADLPETCDVSGIEKSIADLDGRLERAEAVLDDVQQLEGAKQQHAQAVAKKEELTKRVFNAEKVVNAFAPGGPIRAQLVGDGLMPFIHRVAKVMEGFGFGISLRLEPYALEIHPLGRRTTLHPRQLSESEAFRFGIAFQIALAEATGLNFVVIDRSDMLLADLRGTLLDALLESKLDQAIVLVAGDPTPIDEAPMPPETRLYDLAKDQSGKTMIAAEYAHPVKEFTVEEVAGQV